MTRLNPLQAVRRALFGGQPPPTPAPAGNTARAALRGLSIGLARDPNSRVSRDPNDLGGLLSFFEDTLSGYPGDSRRRIIGVLRGLAESDDDVSGSLGDLQALCGAGFTLDFTGGSRAAKAAELELQDWSTRMFPEGGGLQGLIANQVGELALAGASSCEWFPERSRRGVAGVAVVPADEVRIRRDPTTQALIHEQTAPGNAVVLNPRTYLYAAPRTAGRSPYGLPLFLASLFSLDRKRQLLAAEQRVINLMARSALVQAKVPTPEPKDLGFRTENDPGYTEAVAEFFNGIADILTSGSQNGVYVGADEADIKIVPINQTASGAPEITKANQKRVWGALKTLPFMRGEMDSTTQALAQVTIPILHAQAIAMQQTVARQFQFGMNLHLSLRGIPAQAWVRFTPPVSPFLLDEARAALLRAQTDEALARLFGPAWAPQAMTRWDVAPADDQRAPSWWAPGSGGTPPDPTSGGSPS